MFHSSHEQTQNCPCRRCLLTFETRHLPVKIETHGDICLEKRPKCRCRNIYLQSENIYDNPKSWCAESLAVDGHVGLPNGPSSTVTARGCRQCSSECTARALTRLCPAAPDSEKSDIKARPLHVHFFLFSGFRHSISRLYNATQKRGAKERQWSNPRAARERACGPTDGRGRHVRLRVAVPSGANVRCPYACRRRPLHAPRIDHQPDLCATPSRHRVIES